MNKVTYHRSTFALGRIRENLQESDAGNKGELKRVQTGNAVCDVTDR